MGYALVSPTTMTEDSSVSHVTSASIFYGDPTARSWHCCDGADSTYWLSYVDFVGFQNPQWWQIQMPVGKAITKHGHQRPNSGTNTAGPKDYLVRGSNNGTDFTTIATITDQSQGASFTWTYEEYENATTYTYIRFHITAVTDDIGDANGVILGGVALYETVPIAYVWDGSEDTDWSQPDNWTPSGVPTAGDTVEISDGGGITDVVLSESAECLSLDFTGFTGLFDAGVNMVEVYGDATFVAGMTVADVTIYLNDTATLISAGQVFKEVGTGGTGDLTLSDALSTSVLAHNSSGELDFGANELTIAAAYDGGTADNVSFLCAAGSAVAYSAGAKITADVTGAVAPSDFTAPTATIPPVELIGTAEILSFGESKVTCESLTLLGAELNFSTFGVETIGDCTLTSGVLSPASLIGETIDVGGDFISTGVDIPGGAWNVVGTAVASDAEITDADFSGGTELDASDNCVDGEGNTNVNFSSNEAPVSNAGPDQEITLPASATLAGGATDDGLPGPLTYSWAKFSGPGTVNFVDDTDPETDASFSEDGVYVLRLTSDDGELTHDDDVTITVNPIPTSATLSPPFSRRNRR